MARRSEHAARDLHHRLVKDRLEATTRRAFLGRMGTGIGGMALAWRGMRQTYVDRLRRQPNRRRQPVGGPRRRADASPGPASDERPEPRQTAEAGRNSP